MGETRNTYETTSKDKLVWLHRSHLALIFIFGAVLIVLLTFILLPVSPEPGPNQIIIVTPTPAIVPTPTP